MTDDTQSDMHRFLLRQSAPAVDSEAAALRLLVELGTEADELVAQAVQGERPDPEAVAGYRRRRAYVLAHLAELRPEYAEAAADSIARWSEAEGEAIRAAVVVQPAG